MTIYFFLVKLWRVTLLLVFEMAPIFKAASSNFMNLKSIFLTEIDFSKPNAIQAFI